MAAAEMCIAGRLGCNLSLDTSDITTGLFSESNGRFLVEVKPQDCAAFEACFKDKLGNLVTKLGEVVSEPILTISQASQAILSMPVQQLLQKWRGNGAD